MTASIYYQLTETYGNPPNQGGGWIVGSDGSSLQELEATLKAIYGNRLASMQHAGENAPNPLPAMPERQSLPIRHDEAMLQGQTHRETRQTSTD